MIAFARRASHELIRETLPMSVEVVYETHSLSVDNERGIATGWLPGRLSEEGQRLAAELGERRREDGIAVIFTSDLRRAVETAEIAFAGSAMPVRRDARLRECNYGAMNGMPRNAAPGTRLDDLGYAVWKALNLGLIDAPVPEQRRRMMVFTAAYGAILDSTLLVAIEQAQERMRELIAAAAVGTDRDDALDQNRRERIWLEASGLQLVA